MIKAVVFDLDDTLVPEYDFVKSGFKAVASFLFKKYNIDNKDSIYKKLMHYHYKNPKKVFDMILNDYNLLNQIEVEQLVDIYRNHIPSLNLYEDVLTTIANLKNKNIKVGVITDGYKETQRNKIQSLKLNEIFDYIIITDDLGREYWKPNKLAYEIICKKFNVQFNEMIYVGDNPAKDFFISSIYPIKTVRIIREGYYKNIDYLKGIKENYRIVSLHEIMDIIDNK